MYACSCMYAGRCMWYVCNVHRDQLLTWYLHRSYLLEEDDADVHRALQRAEIDGGHDDDDDDDDDDNGDDDNDDDDNDDDDGDDNDNDSAGRRQGGRRIEQGSQPVIRQASKARYVCIFAHIFIFTYLCHTNTAHIHTYDPVLSTTKKIL